MLPFRSPRTVGAPLRVLWLTLSLVLLACNPATPTPSSSPSPSGSPGSPASPGPASPSPLSSEELTAIYTVINSQVQAIRGLEEKRPVVPIVISPAELTDLMQQAIDKETPPEELMAYERLYKAMGLIPEAASLDDVFVDLLASQVAGTYDPTTKKLHVLSKSGAVGPLERSIYAHEYEHALQDQHFDFEAHAAEIGDDSDRGLAWQAVFEGDAYTVGTFWIFQSLTPTELSDIMGQAQDPEAMAVLEKIPPIVTAQILFAALHGTLWIAGIYGQGGWEAIDEVFRDPPVSTEQILHPEKWASREPPIAVELPGDLATRLGAGWKTSLEDTFGEQQLAVWLTGKFDVVPSLTMPPPPDAVAGWGGDRLAVLDGPGETWAVVMKTEWDTADDAAEFETAIEPAMGKTSGPGRVLPGEGGTVRWVVIGSDDAVLMSVAGALGLAG